jgi:uncharacterized phage protein gp47/JayE
MEYKAKVWEQIVFKMILFYKSISKTLTDFSIGSTIRTLFEAVAFEIEELYVSIKTAIETAIRESVYLTFGFERRPAIRSTTTLIITLFTPHEAFIIPKGTRFATSEGITFATVNDVSIDAADTTKDLLVMCTTAGSIGNVAANTITTMVDNIPIIKSVTNPEVVTNGRNMESDASRKTRFVSYIRSLSKGTLEALRYALSTVPEITSISIAESLPGIVKIYISTTTGIVSDEVMNKAKEAIEKYRAAGIQVVIAPVTRIPVDVSIRLGLSNMQNSTAIKNQVQNGIINYLNNMLVGEDLLPNNLMGFIFSLNQSAIRNVEIISPAERLIVSSYSIVRPGNVTIMTHLEEDL